MALTPHQRSRNHFRKYLKTISTHNRGSYFPRQAGIKRHVIQLRNRAQPIALACFAGRLPSYTLTRYTSLTFGSNWCSNAFKRILHIRAESHVRLVTSPPPSSGPILYSMPSKEHCRQEAKRTSHLLAALCRGDGCFGASPPDALTRLRVVRDRFSLPRIRIARKKVPVALNCARKIIVAR